MLWFHLLLQLVISCALIFALLDMDAAATPPVEDAALPATNSSDEQSNASVDDTKWPGWPGHCVFRVIVPVTKVGTIIGRKGDLIKKLCEDTRARVRVLEPPPVPTTDRIVLIFAKEELDAVVSPAMDAVIRVFKRINGLDNGGGDGESNSAETVATAFCSIRLLVASAQAVSLIGKQGAVIKAIQDGSESSVRVLSEAEMPTYIANDERIVELQGESQKVHKALDAVLEHLRKFLVDHSVLPLFEKYSTPNVQELQLDMRTAKPLLNSASHSQVSAEYSMSSNKEMLYLERHGQLGNIYPTSGISLHGSGSAIAGIRSSSINHVASSFVTQITKTMQIPLSYAEAIIGISGTNIAYIRQTSGAALTVQETRGLPEEITVEIKGTSSQVQIAQCLIQDFINNHKEPVIRDYGYPEMGLRSSLLPHNSHTEYGRYIPPWDSW